MSGAGLYKQVMRTYEEERRKAAGLQNKRREEVYEAVPRVREIDSLLTVGALAVTRLVLNGIDGTEGTGGDAGGLEKHQAEMKSLGEEKRALLQAHKMTQDYLTDVYACALCKDTGYVGAKRCACLTQKLIESYYGMSNVRDAVSRENFDAFDLRYYAAEPSPETGVSPLQNIQAIVTACMDFTSSFGEKYVNMLFYGDTGLGKTFLCNCVAKELLDAGKTVLYVTAPQIFKKIENFRFNRTEEENPDSQLEMLYGADLLIIDDLGSELATVVTNTELFNIVNGRDLSRRPTIISTNLALNDLQAHYSDRIVSRLFGGYKMMRFFGDDIRLKKKLRAAGGS